MYISRISFRHVRSFKKLDLDITRISGSGIRTPRKRTIIIGANGTGKTTLLRAIALGLADQKDTSGLLAEPTGQFVSEKKTKATIAIDVQPSQTCTETVTFATTIRADGRQDVLEDKKAVSSNTNRLVCGYGISRANEGPESGRSYRIIDSVYSLFQYEQTLIQTELTLRRLEDFLSEEKYKAVLGKIKHALGLGKADKISLARGGGVRISGPRIGHDIPLEGWADGYRKTLLWILDLYAWAMRANCISDTGDVEGVILVDELEQHLHPSMQTKLPSRLSQLLPRAQIIATTHSPLVALGARPDELVVLTRHGKHVSAQTSVRDFDGYSVEDMLSDPELFDSDVYRPETANKLRRYHAIAKKSTSRRSPAETKELDRLRAFLTAQQVPGVAANPAFETLQRILQKHDL